MKKLPTLVLCLLFPLAACKPAGKSSASPSSAVATEALARVADLSAKSKAYQLMTETGWEEPDPVKIAGYQDTLSRLEHARADARAAGSGAAVIAASEEAGTLKAVESHAKFVQAMGESPRDSKARLEKLEADMAFQRKLTDASDAVESAKRDNADAAQIRGK